MAATALAPQMRCGRRCSTVPHLILKEAASRDAGVGIGKDMLRREGHSEDIAAPEAAPAEHRQAVVSALHLTGQQAALPQQRLSRR